jgi:Holliday junction resolvase RusA-like endonuclease
MFTLTIFCNPVAQGRPRATRAGKFIRLYDPAKSRTFKQLVAIEAQRQVRECGWKIVPIDVPLTADFEFLFDRPASVSANKRPHHVVKPDLENLIKGVKDALSGVVYHDDRQIIKYERALKRYCLPGEQPGVTVKIW